MQNLGKEYLYSGGLVGGYIETVLHFANQLRQGMYFHMHSFPVALGLDTINVHIFWYVSSSKIHSDKMNSRACPS